MQPDPGEVVACDPDRLQHKDAEHTEQQLVKSFLTNRDPFEEIIWEMRDARIVDSKGNVVFEQQVEVPSFWSQNATNIVASKYFRGILGTPEREWSVRQLISRVTDAIAKWGYEQGYYDFKDSTVFRNELRYLLAHQMMAFNSPVWFNVGIEEKPQVSACFINSIEDTMESIMNLAKTEAMLFKYGSGTGTNLSPLRASGEHLAGGGTASGPVSFMKGFDAFAGVVKSGGKTRRAAKMVLLDVDHPDIFDFIRCKATEEKKAHALIEAGYPADLDGPAYSSIAYQNANHSVRVTDDFMNAVHDDGKIELRFRTAPDVGVTVSARKVMREIAEAAWACGDPGIQFDTTINKWHTCSSTDKIHASNPCSEFVFLNDTACNLASLNLMKFVDGRSFDVESFQHAVEMTILAQEILVGSARYPTERITKNSHDYRPLGLGYANLGALLMTSGMPYDSNEGRTYAAGVTSLMTGVAYAMSGRIASRMGPFKGYERNKLSVQEVILKHAAAHVGISSPSFGVPGTIIAAASRAWDEAITATRTAGIRNAQATVLAPTGTIAFMMDCATTGIEPDIALVKYKRLVGGGVMKLVNPLVSETLLNLNYTNEQTQAIRDYVDKNGTIEGAPYLLDEHVPIFDCAFRPEHGSRSINSRGHLGMMCAVQPFISGAISKTVNLPEDTTVDEMEKTFMRSWSLGLKAVALYRDGCKRSQPLTVKAAADTTKSQPLSVNRHRLPDTRQAVTHKFSISGLKGYITVGLFADGSPGEIFVTVSKEGSFISGLMDSFATAISLALQYGVPVADLVRKFSHVRFEPSGFTGNEQIPVAKSIIDYIFRWLGGRFCGDEQGGAQSESSGVGEVSDAPPCSICGSLMVRNGSCYACVSCGSTSGCS